MGKKKNEPTATQSAAERSVESAPRATTGKGSRKGRVSRATVAKGAADADRDLCDTCGKVHRACRAHTKHGPNAGKACGAQVRIGSLLCPKHGGNHPAHKEKARERMADMVMPFLSELRRVVLDPDTDDSVKVRGIQVLLDRTGYGPGSTLTVQDSRFDAMLADAIGMDPDTGVVELDRSLDDTPVLSPAGGDYDEDAEQHAIDERTRQWSKLDAEDEQPYTTRLDPFDGRTVQGEVIDNRPDAGPFPPEPTTGHGEYSG